jgi:uncharacterized integral membrane protein
MVQDVQGTSAAQPAQQKRRLGSRAIASICGVALLLIFMIQNHNDVSLDFLVWSFKLPLWVVILASAVLGAITWIGLGVLRRHRRRVARRERREYGE